MFKAAPQKQLQYILGCRRAHCASVPLHIAMLKCLTGAAEAITARVLSVAAILCRRQIMSDIEIRHTEKNFLYTLLLLKGGYANIDFVISKFAAVMEPEDVELTQKKFADFEKSQNK